MNFKSETIAVLRENNKTVDDIRWIGVCHRKSSYRIPVNEFFANADFFYDSGYGLNEISLALYIVGDGWWMERGEYDGSEWWEFKHTPMMPTDVRHVDHDQRLISLISGRRDFWDDDDDDDEIES